MRKTVATFMLLGAIGCDKGPIAPSVKEDTSVAWQNQAAAKPAETDAYHGPLYPTLPPAPPYCIPASWNPQPPLCDWRDLMVCQAVAAGGPTNTIMLLSDGHRVFLQDTGTAPGYVMYDYPSAWCDGRPGVPFGEGATTNQSK